MPNEREPQYRLIDPSASEPVSRPSASTHPLGHALQSPTIVAISQSELEYGDGRQHAVCSSSSLGLLADTDLSPRERRLLSKYLTPRLGLDDGLWWPIDELGPYLD